MSDMLTPYRRHTKDCPFKAKGTAHRKCECPVWIDGTLGGRRVRKSADTRDWRVAQTRAREWELEGDAQTSRHNPAIEKACEAFKADCNSRGLAKSTQKKYRVLVDQFVAFCAAGGYRSLRQIDLTALREFRGSWKDAARSAGKKLERLRQMAAFFVSHGWMKQNDAKSLKPPVVHDVPTLPFTQEDMAALVGACERLGVMEPSMQTRMKALLFVLRYTGMRISDVVWLKKDQIKDGSLFLRMAKTRVAITIPLPDFLLPLLASVEQSNGMYFATGAAQRGTDCGNWRRRFSRLAKLAGVENAHPHRLRDTFAVDLLQRGVSMDDVSILLGHSSIKITERHYAPWVKSRQVRLEKIIRDANSGF